MELKLEPIEGEKVISEEEKERLRKRAEPIPPEKITSFSAVEQKEIKAFLANLVILTEQIHHEMEQEETPNYFKKEIADIQQKRNALFSSPTPAIRKFIQLLQFFPMEPWYEFELMIAGVRGDDIKHYYETKLNAEVDTRHIQIEDNVESNEEDRMLAEMKCRLTPAEIRNIVFQHSLEDMVKHLILSRRLMSGEFWDESFYNL